MPDEIQKGAAQAARRCGLAGVLLLLFIGCAASGYRAGLRHLEENRYEEAVRSFHRSLPDTARARFVFRELGVAYFRMVALDSAAWYLSGALKGDSADVRALLYLAMTHELRRETPEAARLYEKSLELSLAPPLAQAVRDRVRGMAPEKNGEAKGAVEPEAVSPVPGIPEMEALVREATRNQAEGEAPAGVSGAAAALLSMEEMLQSGFRPGPERRKALHETMDGFGDMADFEIEIPLPLSVSPLPPSVSPLPPSARPLPPSTREEGP